MKDRGNPLTIPAPSLCEGYSINGVIIESVRFGAWGGGYVPGDSPNLVIVKLEDGKVLNFDLHDEVEVDR